LGSELLERRYHCFVKERKTKLKKTLSQLAQEMGESIDNLPIDVLMEAIYNERNAPTSSVLDNQSDKEEKKEKD
jgi:hypothetical protein